MANNINNGITGVIDIPGALRSRGAADGNQVGGVVAYAGDIYDVTAGKNQATLNAEFAEGITNASSSSFSGNYNDLSDIPLQKTAENGFKVNAHGRRKNTASEQDSFAEGAGTTASGQGSHSEGGGTIASGTCSHAEGNNASAVGNSSHAEGSFTTAIGSNSHAEGNNAHAYGSNTHAEGQQETLLPLTTRAYTATSSALYIDTEIFPGCIIYDTDDTPRRVLSCEYQEAGDDYKVVFQGINEDLEIGDEVYVDFCAYGDNSHTEGYDTHTYGESSHAEGVHTITTNEAEHASGMYNMSTANKTLFSVGAGHDGGRMNAFEIDASGNVYIYGVGGYNGTNVTSNSVSDLASTITALQSNSSGISDVQTKTSVGGAYTTVVTSGIAKIDLSSISSLQYAIQDIEQSAVIPSDNRGVVLSNINHGVYATGDQSVAYGYSTTAYGDYAIAGGNGTHAHGDKSVAFGTDTIAWGVNTVAAGNESVAFGTESVAFGEKAYTKGKASGYFGKGRSVSAAVINSETGVANSDPWYILALELSPGSAAGYPDGQGLEDFRVLPGMYITEQGGENYPQQPGWLIKNVEYIPMNLEWLCKVYIDDPNDNAPVDPGSLVVRGFVSEAYSYALGRYLFTTNQSEVAVGDYNVSHKSGGSAASGSGTIFSVGTGILSDNSEYIPASFADPENFLISNQTYRANALEVLTNGSVYVRGVGGYDGRELTGKTDLATVVTNINTRLQTLENSSSSSSPSSSYITYSEGEGYSLGDTTNASGENSFAEGESTTASGVTSHAEGYSTTASGENSHAEGKDALASGENAHAEGDDTFAYGYASHAEGRDTSAMGFASHTEGYGYITGPLELNTNSEYYYDSDDDVLYVFIDSSSSDSNYLNLPVGTVVAVATENTKTLGSVNYYSYISDKLFFVGPVDYECPVIVIKNILPNTSSGQETNQFAPQVDTENYRDGWGYKFTDTIYINFLTGSALGDASHSGGYQTNAVGQKSNTAGIRTVATNDGESAFGRYNVSEDGTIFSIGCGEWDDQTLYLNSHGYSRFATLTGIKAGLNKYTTSKNALMVNEDGDVFIKGIGGYDGMDSTAQGVKSVQQVITELTQQIAALTNNQ